jgi:hypothetical protein
MAMIADLGACPTAKHVSDFRQCGFAGCVDLRVWAKAKRYKYRLEESYEAETNAHIRGDGRWFVEILCRHGLIYPCGGLHLLAYVKRGLVSDIAQLGADDVRLYQKDDGPCVFRFPLERLEEVAAILKPRKRRRLDPERARAIGKATAYGAQSGQTSADRM